MARTKLTNDSKLREFSAVIAYELQMLAHAVQLESELSGGAQWSVETSSALSRGEVMRLLRNALIESVWVHARNLLNFLDPNYSPMKDDVVASDYVSPAERWREVCDLEAETAWCVGFREFVHRSVVHLGVRRLEPLPPPGDSDLRRLVRLLNLLVDAARPELILDDLRRQLTRIAHQPLG